MKKSINMLSSAYKVKGQGVASAYEEQVALVKETLGDEYDIYENKVRRSELTHYHTVDFKFFLSLPMMKSKGKAIGYVHMIPETVENSLKLPRPAKWIFYKYMIKFYKSMTHLVTVNPYFIDKLEEYGVPREKVTYIPNFVSDKIFYRYANDRKLEIRDKYEIPKDKFVVLGVGQLQTRKGIFDFIEIAKSMPDVMFVWAGGFSFGAITDGYEAIKKIMQNHPPNVKFLGILEREEMPDIYNIADLMFLPSFEELFPMTILESMCCGVPLLLRDIDIYENILFDFYLREKTVQGFIGEIERLRSDAQYYEDAVQLALKGNHFYSREHVSHMWKEFYDRCSK